MYFEIDRLRKDNAHGRRSTHLHGIRRATRRLEIRFAPPPHSIPTPLPFTPNCSPACLAHPPESLHLHKYCLLTIANASQLAHSIVSQHTTTHHALSTRPPLPLCILWLRFAGLHGSSNIFFSVQAHFCCLATCVFVCADVSVGVGAFVCV